MTTHQQQGSHKIVSDSEKDAVTAPADNISMPDADFQRRMLAQAGFVISTSGAGAAAPAASAAAAAPAASVAAVGHGQSSEEPSFDLEPLPYEPDYIPYQSEYDAQGGAYDMPEADYGNEASPFPGDYEPLDYTETQVKPEQASATTLSAAMREVRDFYRERARKELQIQMEQQREANLKLQAMIQAKLRGEPGVDEDEDTTADATTTAEKNALVLTEPDKQVPGITVPLSSEVESIFPLDWAHSDVVTRDRARFYLSINNLTPQQIFVPRDEAEDDIGSDYEPEQLLEEAVTDYRDYLPQLDLFARKWLEDYGSRQLSKPVDLLQLAAHCNFVSRIDLALCSYLKQHFPLDSFARQQSFNVILLALLYRMSEGNVCIDLSGLQGLYQVAADWQEKVAGNFATALDNRQLGFNLLFMSLVKRFMPHSEKELSGLLQQAPAVGLSIAETNAPLVYDLKHLYLRRYFLYELMTSDYIRNIENIKLTETQLRQLYHAIQLLFPKDLDPVPLNWQKVAAVMAAAASFTVISGGPGTGKTTTVLKILLLLICLDEQNRNIQMCAPTGKAAARMGEAIVKQLMNPSTRTALTGLTRIFGISESEILACLPKHAVTVQRLIKMRPNHSTPVFHAGHKLMCDVLVVDEVSMLDMALFHKLIAAVRPECRLILLGDKDQLASVEAGSVLGDLCACLKNTRPDRINANTLDFITAMTGYPQSVILQQGKIADHVIQLQFSYRSRNVPEIGQLACLVNEGTLSQAPVASAAAAVALAAACATAGAAAVSGLTREQEQLLQGSKSPQQFRSMSEQELLWLQQYSLQQGDISNYLSCCAALSRQDQEQSWGHDENSDIYDIHGNLIDSELPEEVLRRRHHLTFEASAQEMEQSLAPVKQLFNQVRMQYAQSLVSGEPEPFKPAISYRCLDHAHTLDQYRDEIARRAVDPNLSDNYAPFLMKLKEYNYEISPDHHECEELFALMDRYRLLCSNHGGALGDKALNQAIEREVRQTYLNDRSGYHVLADEKFFPGQIIIITKNDPELGLVNGYVGFCAYEKSDPDVVVAKSRQNTEGYRAWVKRSKKTEEDRVLRVFIPAGSGYDRQDISRINAISTLLLTNYDSGFAMSIHKSQGSEYDKVTIMLAAGPNRVMTRELVYTGITRAKKCVELVSSDRSLYYAITHSVDRASALSERIATPAAPITASDQEIYLLNQETASKSQEQSYLQEQKSAPVPHSAPAQRQEQPLVVANNGAVLDEVESEAVEVVEAVLVPAAARDNSTVQADEEMESVTLEPTSVPAPVRKKRRTKAEIAAARMVSEAGAVRRQEAVEAELTLHQAMVDANQRFEAGIGIGRDTIKSGENNKVKPKRKRRTRAEVEAARAAEARARAIATAQIQESLQEKDKTRQD